MLGYVLLTLLPVAAVTFLVWFYRKKTTERAAASSKRFAEMFGSSAPARSAASGTASPRAAPSPAPAAAPSVSPVLCLKTEKLLSGPHEALFRALAAALPGHLVFPHVTLAAVIELPPAVQGREREQRQRGLAQNAVDFLVCDEHIWAIAAIDLQDSASAETQFKSEYLRAASIRYVRLSPVAVPGGDDLRRLVLSDSAPGG